MEPMAYMRRFQSKIDQIFDMGDEDDVRVPVRRDSIQVDSAGNSSGLAMMPEKRNNFEKVGSEVVNPLIQQDAKPATESFLFQSPSFPRVPPPEMRLGGGEEISASNVNSDIIDDDFVEVL